MEASRPKRMLTQRTSPRGPERLPSDTPTAAVQALTTANYADATSCTDPPPALKESMSELPRARESRIGRHQH